MTIDGETRRDVEAVLRAYDGYLSKLDLEGTSALWDEECAVYMGEEYARPQIGSQALSSHWGRLGARLQAAEVISEIVFVDVLADNLARAVTRTRWSLTSLDSAEPRKGSCWVTVLLRRRDTRWMIVHLMEAPIYDAAWER